MSISPFANFTDFELEIWYAYKLLNVYYILSLDIEETIKGNYFV